MADLVYSNKLKQNHKNIHENLPFRGPEVGDGAKSDVPTTDRTPIYGLNGDVRPDRVWFSGFFVLNGVSISSLFVLNRVSLHLNEKRVHLNL